MISKFATSEISIFVASLSSWGDWYKALFIGTPKQGFVSTRPICFRESEQQGCWCDFSDAQTDLRLCCSHSRVEANSFINGYVYKQRGLRRACANVQDLQSLDRW